MIVNLRREYGQFILSGAQLCLLWLGANLASREGWTICLILMAAVSLIAWISSMRRRRALADIPTSRIASAAQGYVELRGQGRPLDDPPLVSPLGQPCLWFRCQIEEKSGDKWTLIDERESEAPFVLDDGSGRCVIDVENAEILTRHKQSWNDGQYCKTEWRLRIGDDIFALGQFRTIGGSALEFDTGSDVSALLAEWKKDQPSLLKRFDLNGDGVLDMKEWTLARRAAQREVEKMHNEARADPVVHTLGAPPDGQLYLLSNYSSEKLVRHYFGWSFFHLAVFFASLAALPWVWQQTF